MPTIVNRALAARLGVRPMVRALRALGLRRVEPWVVVASQVVLAVTCGFISVGAIDVAVRVGIVLFGGAVYLFGALFGRAGDDLDREAGAEERAGLRGAIAFVAERIKLREDKGAYSKDRFDTELENLQRRCLSQIKQVASRRLGVAESDLLANWACGVEANGEGDADRVFAVRFFDADVTDRTPGRLHPIREDCPGAAQAFTTGESAIVGDTRHPDVAALFSASAAYRSILSIPVRYAHDGEEWVIGVVNIDDKKPYRLTMDLQHSVSDFVYFIGLCEVLKRWPSR